MNDAPDDHFFFYLQILDRGSKKFKEAIEQLKTEHPLGKMENHDGILAELLKQFFIPVTEERKSFILYYLHTGKIISKHRVKVDLLASPERPSTFKYDQPSIILQITGQIRSEAEWKDIWTNLKKEERELLKMDNRLTTMTGLNDPKLRKKWANIDLLLEIYKLDQENWSLSRIKNELEKIKAKLNFDKNTSYTLEDTRRLLKQAQGLLQGL
jgi:hypothetical protein